MSYRDRFANRDAVTEYVRLYANADPYTTILWEIEKREVLRTLRETKERVANVSYLDFACGTGRVIRELEAQVDSAIGVDVSNEMADVARTRVTTAKIVQKDVTDRREPVEGVYDFITAFRFFLNAEPDLRRSAMKGLAYRLRDTNSRVVFNNHANLWSQKIALVPYHWTRSLLSKAYSMPNYMTTREVEHLAEDAGLEIERVVGYGVIGPKLFGLLPHDVAIRVERWMSNNNLSSALSTHKLYVAKLKG